MNPIYKIAAPALLALILTILLAAFFQRRFIAEGLSREEFLRLNETVSRITLEYLKTDNFIDPLSPPSQKQFKDFAEELQRPSIARLTIWNRDRVIVFSDLRSVIGFQSPDHGDLKRLFTEEKPFFTKKKEDTNEPVQSGVGEFLDIYIPIRISGKIVGAVEIHSVIAGMLAPIEMYVSTVSYIVVAGSVSILAIVLVVFSRNISESKRAQEVLKASEERFRSVMLAAPDAMVLADSRGNIVGWNWQAEVIFGYTEQEVFGKPLTLLMPERYSEAHRRRLQASCSPGESKVIGRTVELEGLRKNGSEFPLELAVSTWDAPEGKFYAGIIRDITERKGMEKALRESEKRYRTLFELSPDGILAIDPETTLSMDFNPTAHRQLGYSREEFAKLRISDYEVIEKPEETRAHIEKILREGRDDFETKHRTKQGEIRDVLVTVQKIELSGRPVFHSIFRDITNLRQTEQQITILRDVDRAITSTLDLRSVLDLLLDKIDLLLPYPAVTMRLFNKDSGLLEPAVCRNLDEQEWKAEQWRAGRGPPNVVFETKTPLIATNVQDDPRVHDREFFIKHRLTSYLGLPLIAKDEVLGVLSFYTREYHDFTTEEIGFLITLARQAAMAIHNAQLYEEMMKLASNLAKANKVKDEFLSVMSHEMRTPLNVVLGYAALIKDGVLGEINPEQEKALEKVLSRAKEQLALVSGILHATQLEAEGVKVARHEVNLGDFLKDLRSSYEVPFGKELTLNWDYPSDLPVVKTDSEKVRQILQNLINNAIKFTDKGSVTVSARLSDQPTQNSKLETQNFQCCVEFKVADTGVGIPKEALPVIFEMFRQVDSSETRLYGGVGLGLYIVKKFTELLGGKVEVKSEMGRGSTFTVTMPCEYHQPEASSQPTVS